VNYLDRPLICVSQKEDFDVHIRGSIGTRCVRSRAIRTIRTLSTSSLSPEQSPFGSSIQWDADPAVI
jgi:hypothetical protein